MRLLVVTNDFPPTLGGIENYTYSLVRRWPPEDVMVVTRRVEGWERFDSGVDFEVFREPVRTLLLIPGLVRRLKRLVRDRRIDVVLFPSALPLGLAGRRLGAPYAISVHGGEFMLASRIPVVRSALRSVCLGGCVVLPESSFAEALVRRTLGDDVPTATVTCGVDAERYGKDVALPVEVPSPGPVILSVSRLIARKGPRTLIRSLPLVHERHPDAHLLIVGGGPDLPRLKRLADLNKVADSVTFAGPQPWEQMPRFYSAGDVFALPTRARFFGTETEGLPLVYVEAAASGLPLIGGDVGGVREAVRDGETGFLVNGHSPRETANALIKLIDEPELARRFGRTARQMVLDEFSWEKVAKDFRRALEQHCT